MWLKLLFHFSIVHVVEPDLGRSGDGSMHCCLRLTLH